MFTLQEDVFTLQGGVVFTLHGGVVFTLHGGVFTLHGGGVFTLHGGVVFTLQGDVFTLQRGTANCLDVDTLHKTESFGPSITRAVSANENAAIKQCSAQRTRRVAAMLASQAEA